MSQENGASLKVKSSLWLFYSFPPCMYQGQGPDSFRLKLLFTERFLIRNSKKKTPTWAAYIRNVGIWA